MNIHMILFLSKFYLVFGSFLLVGLLSCSEKNPTQAVPSPTTTITPIIRPEIVTIYPHDPGSFTQGLLYHDGLLYESSGRNGISALRKVVPETGEVIYSDTLDAQYFAEGLALKNQQLVQLTWLSKIAFVYDLQTLAQIRMLTYNGQGWGLTVANDLFVMSDGSEKLFFRDDNFNISRTITVKWDGRSVTFLNELEFARGFIYANVWHQNFILEIDPITGQSKRVIDCSELVGIENPSDPEHVLNGIAYNQQNDQFYITGKNWQNMFVLKIPPLVTH